MRPFGGTLPWTCNPSPDAPRLRCSCGNAAVQEMGGEAVAQVTCTLTGLSIPAAGAPNGRRRAGRSAWLVPVATRKYNPFGLCLSRCTRKRHVLLPRVRWTTPGKAEQLLHALGRFRKDSEGISTSIMPATQQQQAWRLRDGKGQRPSFQLKSRLRKGITEANHDRNQRYRKTHFLPQFDSVRFWCIHGFDPAPHLFNALLATVPQSTHWGLATV
jgi:hypothetical protein